MINRNDPFYQLAEQERRCELGWHNFNTYQNDEKEVMICKVCKHMQLPSDIKIEYIGGEEEPHENKIVGHQTRDGTINFDKTW